MAKGKPVVYVPSDEMPNLGTLRDPELRSSDAEEYVAHVSRLLNDPDHYRRASERAIAMAPPPDAEAFARKFDPQLRKRLPRAISPYWLPETPFRQRSLATPSASYDRFGLSRQPLLTSTVDEERLAAEDLVFPTD